MKKLLILLTVPVLALTLLGLLPGTRPATAAPPGAPGDWWADYFDNATLSGAPVMSRMDGAIHFGWGENSPAPGIPADNFSVRWVRDEWFAGGTYRFDVASDDGVRVWVGDALVVDDWRDRWATPLVVDRYIPQGTYRVRVEYYDHTGEATISARWSRLEDGATWRAEYFGNRDLEDYPVLTRYDGAIDFDWGYDSPDPAVPADYFSVRWTRTVNFKAGDYRFLASTDDGARIWVDGALIVDAWVDQKLPTTHTGDVHLETGPHTVVVEYYEHGGEAAAHVWWEVRDGFTGWRGEYFDNRDFTGGPVLVRDDAAIDFDWGVGPPLDWMPDDNFSVRWTREVDFTPGYYRFVTLADDGVRVWVGDRILIDKWQDMEYELHYVDGTYLQGRHTVRVEYYERAGHARVRCWWEAGTDGNAPPTYLAAPTTVAPAAPASAPVVTAPGVEADDPAPSEWRLCKDDGWTAAYFANTGLSGEPVLTRVETALDHNWGWGSPGDGAPSEWRLCKDDGAPSEWRLCKDDGVPKDNFSARWTQPLTFQGGLYRFTTYTDDGVRLWVDGKLLINSWRPMRGYRSATVRLDEGTHDVQMEYYERTGVALARLTWRRVGR